MGTHSQMKPSHEFDKFAKVDPAEELAIHTLLAEDSITEKQAATLGPYEESIIDGLRVVQVNVDGRSKAQIQGNKLLVKWGPDAPPGSSIRTTYLPKWVVWAKKHLTKKTERVEVKKEWTRTNIDGFSVYDLEGKEQVAAILTKIRHDVQPILQQFGLHFTTLNESVAEGSLGFNRGKRIIALNVRQKQNPMALRKYSAIMSTMLHELAHLRHMNHGPQFKLFEAELVAWARDRGIYAPGGRMADLLFTAEDLTASPVKKTAKSNAKVVEIPSTFHPVELQDPKGGKSRDYPFEGFIDFQGLKIDVENVKGTTRSGEGPEGHWSTYMFAHYGEIRGTEGTDGDKLDVYVGDNHDSSLVVVIHQHNPWDGAYDEDKVILGCESIEEAIGLYKKQYDRPGFFREKEFTAMPIGAFWRWVQDERNKGKKVKTAASVLRITAAEITKRLKENGWRLDRHDQSYDIRTATFYSVFITQRRHNGTKQEHFLVVWYTGNPSRRWDSKTVDTLKDAVVLANKVKPESDRISAEELGESPMGKLAADKWVSVPRLDINTIKDAVWVKWVRITSSGQMGDVVARRMPNGWNAQLLKSGQKYDPKDVRGRPRKDSDLIKLFTDGGGSAPHIVKGEAAAPATPELTPQEKQEQAAVAKRTKGGPNPFVYNPWGKPENGWQIGFYVPRLSEPLWWTGSGFKNLSKVRSEPETFKSKSEAESLVFGKLVKFIADYRAGESHLVIGWDKPHPTSTRAPDVTPPAPAPTPAATSLSVDEVTSFLRSMSTRTGGRTRDVDFYPPGKNGLQSPHWSVEPQNRQRLDHYVGSYYNPGPDDDPEGWDQDGWDEEYAGPLHDEVQSKLDARFGTGVFQVDIGEKGHISVDPTPAGMKALGMGKTGMWKKGYTEGTPGAVNAARTVFSNLLALLRAVQWSHLASHWQSAGEASYGDHLLFERMYGKVVGETDALAEKLVGTFGNLAVDAKEQAKLMAFTLHQMGEHGDPFKRALHIEQTLQVSIKNCVTATENLGQLSLGMDDLLRTMANDHETHIYLIQQRQGGARVASALGRKDPTTRLSVRHILRQVQAAAEAGHLLKPTSVVNLRMRL